MARVLRVPLTVVGAGPSGLLAARTRPHALVLDAGPPLEARRHHIHSDLLQGVGGAGLFSDGKFSFFPAGSGLWSLPRRDVLKQAFHSVREVLEESGLEVPPWPELGVSEHGSGFKPYPSRYLDLASRRELILRLSEPLGDRLWTDTRVVSLERSGQGLRLRLERKGEVLWVETQALLGAGGRFFPLWLARQGVPMGFGRVEVGVRLEGKSDHPLFAELVARGRSNDPKLIVRGPSWELRTFCCCREGELVEGRAEGFVALSGRADVAPTGRSNVGVNLRFLSSEKAPSLSVLSREPVRLPLSRVWEERGALQPILGEVADDMVKALEMLERYLPTLREPGLVVHGPALEGVGAYPSLDGDLAVRGWPVRVVGDATGRFRGLVPAMISGVYAALLAG